MTIKITKQVRDGKPLRYRNKLNGDVFDSKTTLESRYIDGVEFVAVINPRGGLNYVRKDNLEKIPVA
jgi:hypothetical protein